MSQSCDEKCGVKASSRNTLYIARDQRKKNLKSLVNTGLVGGKLDSRRLFLNCGVNHESSAGMLSVCL